MYDAALVRTVLSLIERCPDDSFSLRKDLLVAIKNLLQSELKRSFFGHVERIMDEQFLLGASRHQALRPLTYTIIIDYLSQIRENMSVMQVTRIVHLFSASVHDPSLTIPVQIMCTRCILSMVERIIQLQSVSLAIIIIIIITCMIYNRISFPLR